ncbi:MAG: family 16 glycosylhydrolase [Cytophagaceae bacterium]
MKFAIKITILLAVIFVSFTLAKKYKGAEVRTMESFKYGRFEVRMKSAEGSGMLSSLFTFYDNADFAKNWNEIDIEILGRYNNEVQYNTIIEDHKMHEHRHVLGFNPHQAFHVYSFDWTPDYVAWHVDGKEVYRQEGDHIAKMNKPQKLMMNIWASTWTGWTGSWDETKVPHYAYYDYVSYYEYVPSSKSFNLKWKDDFDTFDKTRWQTATHTFDGNMCDFEPANAVVKDGYLILCLTKEDNIGYNGGPVLDSPAMVEAKLNSDNTIKISFSRELTVYYAKKAYFKIEGTEISKTKLVDGGKGVILSLANTLSDGEIKVMYNPPVVEGQRPSVQEVLVKR